MKRLDDRSKDILRFRPVIDFVEPDQEPETPNPIDVEPDELQPSDVQNDVRRIKRLADAVNVLATAVQARVDRKAKDLKIKLDPNVDAAALQAMRRQFPEAFDGQTRSSPTGDNLADFLTDDPNADALVSTSPIFITYDQYKRCRDMIRDFGCAKASGFYPTQEEVGIARDELSANRANIGGLGTPEALDGGLRPELYERGRIVDPINLEEFQNLLIKILINYCWKNFLLPLLREIPVVGDDFPEQLVKLPKGFKIPDLIPQLK